MTAASVDVFYGDPDTGDAQVVEMESATIFQVAKLRGARAASILGVSDKLENGERIRISQEDLEALGISLGAAGYALVASS